MVENFDMPAKRVLLSSFLVFCSYSLFAPTSRAIAEDEIPRAANATSPAAADPAVRQIVRGFQPLVPWYRVDYSHGFDGHGPAFDRWFYVKKAIVRLHSNPLLREIPRIGHYHVLYPAYPRYRDASVGRVDAAQGYGIPGAVPLHSNAKRQYNFTSQYNYSHRVLAKPDHFSFSR